MNEKIIMLGTGSAMVTDCYNTCFLLKSENEEKTITGKSVLGD